VERDFQVSTQNAPAKNVSAALRTGTPMESEKRRQKKGRGRRKREERSIGKETRFHSGTSSPDDK